MADLLNRDQLRDLFQRLSQTLRSDVTIYLTGDPLVIYHGIRHATTDIDFGYDVPDPVDREAVPEMAQRTAGSDIQVQCSEEISGWSLIPLPGYRERAPLLERYGRLTVKSVHPVDLVLAKVHRGYGEDLADAKALVGHFHLSNEEIMQRFNEIFAVYPASTEKRNFRQGYDRFVKLLQERK